MRPLARMVRDALLEEFDYFVWYKALFRTLFHDVPLEVMDYEFVLIAWTQNGVFSNNVMKQKHYSHYTMRHGTVSYAEHSLNPYDFEGDYSCVCYCTLCFGNCTGQFPVGATVRSQPVLMGRNRIIRKASYMLPPAHNRTSGVKFHPASLSEGNGDIKWSVISASRQWCMHAPSTKLKWKRLSLPCVSAVLGWMTSCLMLAYFRAKFSDWNVVP